MEDTSFIDLIDDENLEKIVIDKRLIPAFKKCMINFQRYFNKMGYTKTRDYKKFFQDYLLNPYYRLLIRCNKEPDKDGCYGFYNSKKKTLVIDESCLESIEKSLSVFTHEFIHFMVLNDKSSNNNLLYSPPINEALTEILTKRILPITRQSYLQQIEMLKFWLVLYEKEIDYNEVLNNGKFYEVDAYFNYLFNEYHSKFGSQHIIDAKNNKKYIEMQRYLIKLYSLGVRISNMEEYDKLIFKMSKRVVEDKYFMNMFYSKIENRLCDYLDIHDKSIRNRFMMFLKEYRKLTEYIVNNNNFKFISKFEYDGFIYRIDYKKNMYIDDQLIGKPKWFELVEGDKFYLKNIDFKKLKNKRIKVKNELLNKQNRLKDILKYIIFVNNEVNKENRMEEDKVKVKNVLDELNPFTRK